MENRRRPAIIEGRRDGPASVVSVKKPGFVQILFAFIDHDAAVTTTERRPLEHPADSLAAERLWEALSRYRADDLQREVADLEDALFRLYLPMARTLAHDVKCETTTERLGPTKPQNSAWPMPSSDGSNRRAAASGASPGLRFCVNSLSVDGVLYPDRR